MKQQFCKLTTPFEQNSTTNWQEYPRPQMKRDSYHSLCGQWDLWVMKKGRQEYCGKISVPFVPESALSGIERTLQKGEMYSYEKEFELPEEMQNGRILLHFGAVDQLAKVYVNGKEAGEHVGGYLPFSLDITDLLIAGKNVLTVQVIDNLDQTYGYGKQRKKRGGMWYTPISGIWQAVWMKSVPQKYIASLKITPTLDGVTIETTGGEQEKILTVLGKEYRYQGDRFTFTVEHPHLWTPEDPYLYDFSLVCGQDKIESYFALRTVTIGKVKGVSRLLLNGKPYFFHGLLDQGYFSDGIYLPASPDGYIWDIENMKKLGFNTLRKHIKIEPDLFYYYCDKMGMIVFQDMVNCGKYGFVADTALPTIGIKKRWDRKGSPRLKSQFEADCRQTIATLYNHPCVCYYTIFNEGWGQYDADRIYGELKQQDPTRIWDATSGWFAKKDSDVDSEHIYFRKINLSPSGRPIVLSEFGGYACNVEGHIFNTQKDYGYKTCQSMEKLEEDLVALYQEQVIPFVKIGLCGAILTQVSDVEDEINGLVTYDRQVIKVTSEKMVPIAKALQNAIEE